MYLCDKGHDEIVFRGTFGDKCPLCRMKKHRENLMNYVEKIGLDYDIPSFEEFNEEEKV